MIILVIWYKFLVTTINCLKLQSLYFNSFSFVQYRIGDDLRPKGKTVKAQIRPNNL